MLSQIPRQRRRSRRAKEWRWKEKGSGAQWLSVTFQWTRHGTAASETAATAVTATRDTCPWRARASVWLSDCQVSANKVLLVSSSLQSKSTYSRASLIWTNWDSCNWWSALHKLNSSKVPKMGRKFYRKWEKFFLFQRLLKELYCK